MPALVIGDPTCRGRRAQYDSTERQLKEQQHNLGKNNVAEGSLNLRRHARDGFGRWLERISFLFAVGSGLILTAMALMSMWSIVGRWLFNSPLMGDFELVQLMTVMAVSLTLPYTQWARGHVIVDFFTTKAPAPVRRALDVAAHVLMAAVAALVCWRCYLGGMDAYENFEMSMMWGLPLWWGYVPLVPSFGLFALISLYSVVEIVRGDEA